MNVPARAPFAGVDAKDAERIAGIVASRLPRPLVPVFDARFARSSALYDEFIYRLTLGVFCDTGLAKAAGAWGTTDELVDINGIYQLTNLNAILSDLGLDPVSAGGLGKE